MRNCCVVGFVAVGLAIQGIVAAAETVSVVTEPTIANPRQPQAAVSGNRVYVAFGADQCVYVSASHNGGRSYRKPVKVGTLPGLALGLRRGPRIVANDNAVVVSAIGHTNGNLWAWRSTDGGITWSDPVQVNDSTGHASEGLHAMAIGPNGQIYCVWLDHRNKVSQIFGAGSSDGGKSWDNNQRVYAPPSGSVCECCHPSAAYAANGDLYVMWRNSLDGYRDMYLAVAEKGAKEFSTAKKVGTGSWKLAACPMDGGCLAISRDRDVATIWRREKQVFYTGAQQRKERMLGTGMQPWAAATRDGPYLVWISRRNGDLRLKSPHLTFHKVIAGNAADPVIASPTHTGEGPVIIAWESKDQDRWTILSRVVDDPQAQ